MSLPNIDNLRINKVTDDILLIHQIKPPFYFSCCDGLLIMPKEGRNSSIIALDLNIEPKYVQEIVRIFGPVSDYVCTHGHMDHIAHVHAWEDSGAKIMAPFKESNCLLGLKNFYHSFGFNEAMNISVIEKFGKINGYRRCKKVNSFKPGSILKFDDLEVETLPLFGHSKAHVGFLLPEERIIHISCLGFDQPSPGKDGFGPWYGFKECSIEQYYKDIDYAESFFLRYADFLTSSHAYIVENPDVTPFNYMRKIIKQNQRKLDLALAYINLTEDDLSTLPIGKLLDLDIFFPKQKMKGFLRELYGLWEFWIIKNHIRMIDKN